MTENAKFELFGDTLPADARVLTYEATEGISTLFRVSVEFSTEDREFDVEQCLRSRALLAVTNEAFEERFFDGIVQQAEFTRVVGETFFFRLELGPALQALAQREDCRIFQGKSVVDVVKEIFAEAGLTEKVEWKVTETYPEREFIVQYRESTLAFVSRLLEENGIFYYFLHEQEGHKMVLADTPEAFVPAEEGPVLAVSPGLAGMEEPIAEFSRKRTLSTSSVQIRDYDFEKPQVLPDAMLPVADAWTMPYFEYPAGFVTYPEGKRLSRVRVSERRATSDVCRGSSSAVRLLPGAAFTLEGADDPNLDGQYIVTGLVSAGAQVSDVGAENSYCSNSFDGIPVGAPFAPARRVKRPRIRGIQTAVVTGAENEEQGIHTDKYGRIKVRFYWDRVGQQDDGSSCWLRVAQVQMGGTMVLPRVGWEVSVAFLEGDPDRPLVLGRVYNGELQPPMALPAGKASGCLRSMSSPGGGGMNEIGMGDSGGSQGHGISAQKDLNMTTGNDANETIAVDDSHIVNVNMSRSIGADEAVTVGGNQTVSVGQNQNTKVAADQSITVGGNDSSNATGNYLEQIGGSRDYTVGANETVISNAVQREISGSFSRTVGAVEIKLAVGSVSDNVLGPVTSSVGAVRVHLAAGSHGETVGGAKSETTAAAAAHLTAAGFDSEAGAVKANTIGGVHFRKVAGDFTVKAPMITLAGGMGQFKGGGGKLSLSGGPVALKGSKVSVKSALVKKTGGSMKMG